jgi:hypothetical protein
MFERADVEKLVECAAAGLEREDRHIRECEQQRGWPPNRWGSFGLWRNCNERYDQFVIWSELMCSFPWLAETERDERDLAFFDAARKLIGYAEIKCWRRDDEREIPGMRRDIEVKLGGRREGGVMLILTATRRRTRKRTSCGLPASLEFSATTPSSAVSKPLRLSMAYPARSRWSAFS